MYVSCHRHFFLVLLLNQRWSPPLVQEIIIIIIIIVVVVVIVIIIIIIIISFMQGIYTYIPETNYVPREYSIAAILLLFMVLILLVSVLNLLYSYISTFQSMSAVPNMVLFWSSLTSCFLSMLLTYFLNDWSSPSRPYYYWYHLHFYIPHALYFYCKVFIF